MTAAADVATAIYATKYFKGLLFDISDLEIGEEEAEQQQQQYIYL